MTNIFKSVYRNFLRKPVINLINLLGLAVSLALVVYLSVYCYSQLTTDHFHKNGDRVYLFGQINERIYTPAILKEQIDLNVPSVESTVRIGETYEDPVFQVGKKGPITSDLIFADEDFFKLFSYHALNGNLESALREPMTVVITKTLSEKLFGKQNTVGEIIKMNNNKNLTVAAVIEESKENSCLSFSAVTSIATRKVIQPNGEELTNWGYGNFQTFVLLKKETKPEIAVAGILNVFPEDRQTEFSKCTLTPLKDIYFSGITLFGNNYLRCEDKNKVMVMLLVAALVLIIAVVNFINISSSQWLDKTRQTGVMKIIGANRTTIFFNVLAESYLLFLMALFIAIVLAATSAKFIGNYTGILFNQNLLYNPFVLLIFIVGTFVLSTIFSMIPAHRISSSRAVDNLKKTVGANAKGSSFRGALVIAQYVIAIVLVSFTVLVQKQVNFGSNLGFKQDNILGIKLTEQLYNKKEVLNKMLQEKPEVRNVSFTQYFPGKQISGWGGVEIENNGEKKRVEFNTFTADAGFAQTIGLTMIEGCFYPDNPKKNAVVVNEAFVRFNGLSNPVGSKIHEFSGRISEITGVVKDFHFKPINEQISPLVIRNESYASYCLIKLQTKDFNSLQRTIQDIKAETAVLSPSFPVEISFFDQAVENMYRSEIQFRRMFSLFAGCAVVICCLGILAMSVFAAQHRIKEIGVRKVNGAKVSEILYLLNQGFIIWVIIAFLIACPVSWFVMNKWLESFAYKTELSWWIFATAGAAALTVALVTVSWQSWRAAKRNPVESLKYE